MMDAEQIREWADSKSDPRRREIEIDGTILEVEALTVGEDETFQSLTAGPGPAPADELFALTLPKAYAPNGEQIFSEAHVERAVEADTDSVYAEIRDAVLNLTYRMGPYADAADEAEGDGENGDPGN